MTLRESSVAALHRNPTCFRAMNRSTNWLERTLIAIWDSNRCCVPLQIGAVYQLLTYSCEALRRKSHGVSSFSLICERSPELRNRSYEHGNVQGHLGKGHTFIRRCEHFLWLRFSAKQCLNTWIVLGRRLPQPAPSDSHGPTELVTRSKPYPTLVGRV